MAQSINLFFLYQAHDLNGIAHLIKIEDIAQPATSADEDVHNLVIDTRGDNNLTEVSHTAEALEGLQALAEQAGLIDNIIEEQVGLSTTMFYSTNIQSFIDCR